MSREACPPQIELFEKIMTEGVDEQNGLSQTVHIAPSGSERLVPPVEQSPEEGTIITVRPGGLVRRLYQICVSIFLEHARDYELTPLQYALLRIVDEFPGIHQARVVGLLALDRQTVSNVSGRLAAKGLIERRKGRGRTSGLFLTGSARGVLKAMEDVAPGIDQEILSPLAPEEQRTLLALMAKLVNANNSRSRAPAAEPESAMGD